MARSSAGHPPHTAADGHGVQHPAATTVAAMGPVIIARRPPPASGIYAFAEPPLPPNYSGSP